MNIMCLSSCYCDVTKMLLSRLECSAELTLYTNATREDYKIAVLLWLTLGVQWCDKLTFCRRSVNFLKMQPSLWQCKPAIWRSCESSDITPSPCPHASRVQSNSHAQVYDNKNNNWAVFVLLTLLSLFTLWNLLSNVHRRRHAVVV